MADAMDLKIIEILRSNSRTPYLSMAKSLGLSESAIRKRVSNLESRGTIRQYSLVVDTSKIGYQNVAFIGVDARPEKYLEVAKKLRDNASIKCVATSVGDHMFMLEVWAKDNNELQNIYEKIKAYEGVLRICPAIIKETLRGFYN